MNAVIAGIGAWGPGFRDRASLEALFADGAHDPTFEKPAPTVIPARERRRAPLSVKQAVEVASQACEAAGIEPADAANVFASGLGDLDITEYMCRTLAGDQPQLSPTKFHNSVHNAPVGYWSISTGAKLAGNAVAGGPSGTLAASLLEAHVQCDAERRPVLWVTQDIAAPEAWRALWPVDGACAFALVLLPLTGGAQRAPTLELVREKVEWPELRTAALRPLYATNPSARTLALLEARAAGRASVDLPLHGSLACRVRLQ